MEIIRSGNAPSVTGPGDYFVGTVRIDAPFQGTDGAKTGGATVTFEPGARTHWHTHPLGQTLLVTAGKGWVQKAGEPIHTISPGDIVWIKPGERHWHGATDTTAMTHIAIAESENGSPVTWLEPVSDNDYLANT